MEGGRGGGGREAELDQQRFGLSVALRPQKPVGLLGTGAEDGHLDFHTAPELWKTVCI